MATGIKETLDVVTLVERTAEAISAAKADGSIDWKDLAKLGPVVVAMKDAVAQGNLVPGEVSELDAQEIQILFDATLAALGKLVLAIVG